MAFTVKYYTADCHFGHTGMLTMAPASRGGFATVEDMDRALIEGINARVSKTDILYIVGDFAITKDDAYVRRCFHAINGKKRLIIGNHDVDRDGMLKPVLASLPWDSAPVWSEMTSDEGQRLFLAHYAHRAFPGQHKGGWHFYGHSHGNIPHEGRTRDVGVDVIDSGFAPFTFREATAGYQIDSGVWA